MLKNSIRKSYSLFSFIVLFQASFAQNWQQLPNFPGLGRDDGSAFTIGNNVYCGAGSAAGIGPSTDFFRFNPLNDTWSTYTVASLPVIGRQYCSSFSYNQYGFIVGGVDANGQASNFVLKYDTTSNTWAQKNNMPDSVQGAVCFFINNKAYICGGRDWNNKCTNKVWQYDPSNDTWLQKNNMPEGGRWRASGTVIFNKGYLIFGVDSANKFSNKIFEFNPVLDSWILTDSFPGKGRAYASAFIANNLLVVALGIDSSNAVYNDCYAYDVTLHQWQTKTPLPSFGRKGCMAFNFNNNIYLTTGIDGSNNRLTETWKAGNLNDIFSADKKQNEVSVYPNPAHDKISVISSAKLSSIIIYTILGDPISPLLISPTGEKIETMDVSGLSNGIYFVTTKTANGTCTQKIILQH